MTEAAHQDMAPASRLIRLALWEEAAAAHATDMLSKLAHARLAKELWDRAGTILSDDRAR